MSEILLRPFDVSGDWQNQGSGALNDDSDTTYKIVGNAYQYGNMMFSLASLPWDSNIIITYMRVAFRAATQGGLYIAPTIWVFAPDRVVVNAGNFGVLFGTINFNIVTSPFFANPGLRNEVLTVTVNFPTWDNLQPQLGFVYVAEAYMYVDYALPPTTIVTGPTGTFTTTGNPPITWVHQQFDSAGGPQVAYQLIIYNATQYGAAGFSPGSGPSVYNSGTVVSTLKTLTVSLPNDTYRVYVRTAQRIQGVGLHWASWASSDFVINVAPPATPTITATSDATRARVKLDLSGTGSASSVKNVFEIQRTYDGGITWEAVRGDQGAYTLSVGGTRTIYDYEVPNGVNVQYRARTISFDIGDFTLMSSWSSTTSAVQWTSNDTWLKVVSDPTLNLKIIIREFGDEQYPIDEGVFQGLGSSKAMVITGVRRERPDSRMVLLAQTDAEQLALRAALGADVVLIQASPRSSDWKNENRYLTVGTVSVQRPARVAQSPIRDVIIPYTEVDAPLVDIYPLSTLGTNTWAEISSGYATYTALDAAFSTHGALRG